MRRSIITVAIVGISSAPLFTQTTYPFIDELKQNYTAVKNNLQVNEGRAARGAEGIVRYL
jgi:hypothetical protein